MNTAGSDLYAGYPGFFIIVEAGITDIQGRKPKKDANLIHTLKAARLIILVKANLSELGNLKGWDQMAGWSAVKDD
ncbi:hypothetical protein CEP53_008002 [Fusarium sp. AF-6]|nr:hypothetical protein CEP53_008002 [Fusarium sp. AF-6]